MQGAKPRNEDTPPAIVRLLSERIVSSATFALGMSLTNAECGWESGESSGNFDRGGVLLATYRPNRISVLYPVELNS